MGAAPKARRMSVAEFHEWNERQELGYELVDGFPVPRDPVPDPNDPARMMTGAARPHRRVVINIVLAIGPQLDDTNCAVDASDGAVVSADGQSRYPDVMVSCDPDPDDLYKENPVMLFEVTSPRTKMADRVDKLDEYLTQPRLQVYAIVDPNQIKVVVYERAAEGWTTRYLYDLNDEIVLREPRVRLTLADVYRRLDPPPARLRPVTDG